LISVIFFFFQNVNTEDDTFFYPSARSAPKVEPKYRRVRLYEQEKPNSYLRSIAPVSADYWEQFDRISDFPITYKSWYRFNQVNPSDFTSTSTIKPFKELIPTVRNFSDKPQFIEMKRKFTAAPNFKKRQISKRIRYNRVPRPFGFSNATTGTIARRTNIISNRTELKTVDCDFFTHNQLTLNSTPQITLINAVQEGAGGFNRIGRKIMMKSIRITGVIAPTGNATANVGELNRMALVYDRAPNGAFPVFTDIFNGQFQTGTNIPTLISGPHPVNFERFIVLREKYWVLPTNSGASTNGTVALVNHPEENAKFDMYIKLPNLVAHYSGTTNPVGIGQYQNGALYIVTNGSSAAGSEYSLLGVVTRLRFWDHH